MDRNPSDLIFANFLLSDEILNFQLFYVSKTRAPEGMHFFNLMDLLSETRLIYQSVLFGQHDLEEFDQAVVVF